MEESFNEGLIQASLIKQLQNILHQYPDDGQILKELIQNAEDAGASKVIFLYDQTQYGEDSLVHVGLASHQGPALYAYNDAVFSDNDWEGIRMIQDSVKTRDPLKVGRFGLGFKSVFHLTDLPGMMSGNMVGFVDPMEKYFTNVQTLTDESGTKQWEQSSKTSSYALNLRKDLLEKYPHQYQPFINRLFGISKETLEQGSYQGTLFRFPLRKHPSDISKNVYTEDKVRSLIELFATEAHHLLLFLKKVQTIEFYEKLTCNDEPHLLHSVSIAGAQMQVSLDKRNEFFNKLKNASANQCNIKPMSVSYYMETHHLKTKENSSTQKKWLVSQYYGQSENKLQENVRNLPIVGVALPIDEDVTTLPKGHVFCFLPLPLHADNQTGFNFHVNGYFAVAQNRRHIKWPTKGQSIKTTTDDDLKWNYWLLEHVLPQAMIECLQFATEFQKNNPHKLSPEHVYGLFPNKEKVKENWEPVMHSFTKLVQNHTCLHVATGNWIRALDAYSIHNVEEKYKDTIREVLKSAEVPLAEPPKHVEEIFKQKLRPSDPELVRKSILSKSSAVTLCRKDRENITTYIFDEGNVTDLIGLELLELCNGQICAFQPHTPNNSILYIETTECQRQLLPSGYEDCVVNVSCQSSTSEMYTTLSEIASTGQTQLKKMSHNDIPHLLQNLFSGTDTYVPNDAPFNVGEDWLKQLWKYICQYHSSQKKLDLFKGIPFIPVAANQWKGLEHNQPYIFEEIHGQSLHGLGVDKDILAKLGFIVVENGEYMKNPGDFFYRYICRPNATGILDTMIKLEKSTLIRNIKSLSELEKMKLRDAISSDTSYSKAHHSLLKELPLLKCYATVHNEEEIWTDKSSVQYCAKLEFPVLLPCNIAKKEECEKFAKLVSVKPSNSTKILKGEILPIMQQANCSEYRNSDVTALIENVLDELDLHMKREKSIIKDIVKVPFMSTKKTNNLLPSQVIDPEKDDAGDIFKGLDIFPDGVFAQEKYLSKFRLYGSLKSISSEEIFKMAEYLDKHEAQRKMYDQAMKVLKFINVREQLCTKELCKKVCNLKWVPVKLNKPRHYPKELSWYGCRGRFATPNEIMSDKYESIVAATKPLLPIAEDELASSLLSHFKWEEKKPSVKDAVSQISKLEAATRDHAGLHNISLIVNDIYEHLNSYNESEVKPELLELKNWLWNGQNFVMAENVVLTKPINNTEPYLYALPQDFTVLLKNGFFTKYGVKEEVSLEEILFMIKAFHDDENSSSSQERKQHDLSICIEILLLLKDKKKDIMKDTPDIPIPIYTVDESLKLVEIKHCTYCDSEMLKRGISMDDVQDLQQEGDELYIIHSDISPSVAKSIGVPSLMSRYLDADELDIGYGQSEPLTRRINTLLEDYKDGSSVLKELLQNADDAGADKVCFLYDLRTFSSSPDKLIDPKMKELQGPALLCYNDAQFTDEDFENIVKLSGATKKDKTEKIGRFGLGFNAVYNLTDCPSFISNSNFVIFDPQVKYISQAVKDRSNPGIKLHLQKHAAKIRRLMDQFQTFHGIMGCDLQNENAIPNYSGTLFRFPLRTSDQASESEICNKYYSHEEVKELFTLFQQNARNLLLFTQNVKDVQFYVIDDTETIDCGGIQKTPVCLLKSLETAGLYDVTSGNTSLPEDKWRTELQILKKAKNHGHSSALLRNDFVLRIDVTLAQCCIFEVDYKEESYWSISTVIANDLAEEISKYGNDLLAIGGVAVELEKCSEMYCLKPRSADYQGQIFCFLPLPIKNGLPFHINGYFAVTPNRRQLCNRDLFDKEEKKALWNEALMKTAVSKALAFLLYDLVHHTEIVNNSNIGSEIFDLFPTSVLQLIEGKQNLVFELVRSFYKYIMHKDDKMVIFPRGAEEWSNFHTCCFLDQSLRSAKSNDFGDIGEDIVRVCRQHFTKHKRHFIDLPVKIAEQIKEVSKRAKCEELSNLIESKVIRIHEFYEEIFICNIKEIDEHVRDNLLIFALIECRDKIGVCLQGNECIPVTSDQMVSPKMLVDPDGPLQSLYSESDGPFPIWLTEQYSDQVKPELKVRIKEALKLLGMRYDRIENEEVIERASTINGLDPEPGKTRAKCLLNVLAIKMHSGEDNLLFVDMCRQLESIQFLPLTEKSKTWELPWHNKTSSHHFAAIKDAYPENQKELVGCTECIVNFPLDSSDLKKHLGYINKELKIEQIDAQLDYLVDYVAQHSVLDTSQNHFINKLLGKIYSHLNKAAKDNKELAVKILDTFGNKPLIGIISKSGKLIFACPKDCAKKAPDCEPYLFSLPKAFSRDYKELGAALEIKDTPDVEQFINLLKTLQLAKEGCIEGELETIALNIVPSLAECIRQDSLSLEDVGDIFLPDINRCMVRANALCFNNCYWVEPDENNFLHKRIIWDDAKVLGVKTMSEEMLTDHQEGIPFGQSEKLTNRIRRILDGYPCDKEILKELLQNADDAGASEIHFILDSRTHSKEKLFCDEWETFQGPALLVYNDKPFTNEDLEGIKNLGEGSKGNDPLKTGKYGVGFNCVYHLTDTPTFLTTKAGSDEKLLVAFDPLCKYVPMSNKKDPGQMWKNINKLQHKFPGVFECYHLPIDDLLLENGTLFRFPLRTTASELSKNVVSTDGIKELFYIFFEHMAECLLFLGSVRKITISEIDESGTVRQLDEVSLELRTKDNAIKDKFMKAVKSSASDVKSKALTGVDFSQLSYCIETENKTGDVDKWMIVQQIGFRYPDNVDEKLVMKYKNKGASLLPRAGVAYHISSQSRHSNPVQETVREHRLFCLLPLPITTDFPMHINGYFSLDHVKVACIQSVCMMITHVVLLCLVVARHFCLVLRGTMMVFIKEILL